MGRATHKDLGQSMKRVDIPGMRNHLDGQGRLIDRGRLVLDTHLNRLNARQEMSVENSRSNGWNFRNPGNGSP